MTASEKMIHDLKCKNIHNLDSVALSLKGCFTSPPSEQLLFIGLVH